MGTIFLVLRNVGHYCIKLKTETGKIKKQQQSAAAQQFMSMDLEPFSFLLLFEYFLIVEFWMVVHNIMSRR